MRLELIFPLQRGAALPIELCSLAHFINILLERVDSNHRSRKTADLQSAAFDRSATLQFIFLVPQDRVELSRLSILAPKASGSTNSPTVAIYYFIVARSRVELLFRACKSLVLTDRRTGHLIKNFKKFESLVRSVISRGTSIPIVLCKVLKTSMLNFQRVYLSCFPSTIVSDFYYLTWSTTRIVSITNSVYFGIKNLNHACVDRMRLELMTLSLQS